MTMERLPVPLLARDATDGWSFEQTIGKNRIQRLYTETFDHVFPSDVFEALVKAAPGGGAGAKTTSATLGAGGGGAGQTAWGILSVMPNEHYIGTVGLGGISAKYPGDGGGNANGNPGGNSVLMGPLMPLTLLGGNPGLANGSGGGVRGPATYQSRHGIWLIQGAAGGNGQNNDVGLPGGESDIGTGGLGGNSKGGGGGGATPFARGGNGGNYGVAASAVPDALGGSGGGGGGADVSLVGQFSGADGSNGFWYFEYWTEEESM